MAIGAVTGLIGTTIANLSPDVQAIYEKGYADTVRARRKSTSLKGGLLGTVAFIVLVASSGS